MGDKKNYVLNAGTGEFKIIPGSANLVANAATVAILSITSPTENSVIEVPSRKGERSQGTFLFLLPSDLFLFQCCQFPSF